MAPQIEPHGLQEIQFLMRTGVLANTEALHLCMLAHHLNLCAACQFGKQRQRPSPGN